MANATNTAPIVLVHGIFGFDKLTVGGANLADYFRQIPAALRNAGFVVPNPPRLDPAGKVVDRANQLKQYLDDEGIEQVHLIAHSMGGLDSRSMISHLGMANRVLSLTTIDTPHAGSPIADLVVAGTNPLLSVLVEQLGVPLGGINDLTTAECARRNADTPEVNPVRYFSIAARFDPPHVLGVPGGILGLSHDIIQAREGDNDGMVSVASATFGQNPDKWTLLDTWEGNHFRVINWATDILTPPSELADSSIVDKYKALAARVVQS